MKLKVQVLKKTTSQFQNDPIPVMEIKKVIFKEINMLSKFTQFAQMGWIKKSKYIFA